MILGVWVFVSLYQYMRYGTEFRLRSRWMLVFDSVRYVWRRLQAKLHGHEHVEPLEMSSYGPRTAFGVGMIHGIGAETGTQVLIIAAVGGAAGAGLGMPMMLAFIVGLLISNTVIVIVSSTGFVASQARQRVYLAFGVAGRRVQPGRRPAVPVRARRSAARARPDLRVHRRMTVPADPAWGLVRDRLHERGLRWTPQRRTLVEVLSRADGHVTGSELVERCRAIDPETTPSTVYRTLDVLEELGLVRHGHGADGREEFHVMPDAEHGHLHCSNCGGTWEIEAGEADDARRLARGESGLRRRPQPRHDRRAHAPPVARPPRGLRQGSRAGHPPGPSLPGPGGPACDRVAATIEPFRSGLRS